jgi:hypothetical protein
MDPMKSTDSSSTHRYKFRIALTFNRHDRGKNWETEIGKVILNSCQDMIELAIKSDSIRLTHCQCHISSMYKCSILVNEKLKSNWHIQVPPHWQL